MSDVDIDPIYPPLLPDVNWFAEKVVESIGERLVAMAVYGPAVTEIYDRREHQIHFLIVTDRRDVDALLRLAAHSKAAARRRIAPPLVTTETAMASSRDVFALEWIDIAQYHHVIRGELDLRMDQFSLPNVRLQCERDLRSLDIQLGRGILASGGQLRRISRLEQEAADTLVRVMRGILFLDGVTGESLPNQTCQACSSITSIQLDGCREAIKIDGRHDLETVKKMVDEIAALSQWVDAWSVETAGKSAGKTADKAAGKTPENESDDASTSATSR